MKQLENKVALITGAGSGMGQTHAKVFAERGAVVVINDLTTLTGSQKDSLQDGDQVYFGWSTSDARIMLGS